VIVTAVKVAVTMTIRRSTTTTVMAWLSLLVEV
jgi:hypothetical protein